MSACFIIKQPAFTAQPPMITYHHITRALKELGLEKRFPVIAHIPNTMVEHTRGGEETVLGALLAYFDNFTLPAFTMQALIIPEFGPEENAVEYGSARGSNLNAEIFTPDLACQGSQSRMGEALRAYPQTYRSTHPVFSFVGLGLDAAMAAQTADQPYGLVQSLMEMKTWFVLMGGGMASNYALHYAEQQSGRKQFLRWALTGKGVVELPAFPGCAEGFHKLEYYLQSILRRTYVDEFLWQAAPLRESIRIAVELLHSDPYALLCNDLNCERCNLVRRDVRRKIASATRKTRA